jgi:hypothetical protein
LGFVLAMVLLVALVVAWALLQVDTPHSTLDATAGVLTTTPPTRTLPAPNTPPRALADEPPGPTARAPVPAPISLVVPSEEAPPPAHEQPIGRIVVDAGLVIFQLNRAGIAGAIHFKMSDMAGCYEAWLEQDPTLQGHMVVGFRIVADDAGTSIVDQVQILDGGLGQRAMDGCVLNVFQDLRFEHSDEPIEVHYPLTFSSSEDAG